MVSVCLCSQGRREAGGKVVAAGIYAVAAQAFDARSANAANAAAANAAAGAGSKEKSEGNEKEKISEGTDEDFEWPPRIEEGTDMVLELDAPQVLKGEVVVPKNASLTIIGLENPKNKKAKVELTHSTEDPYEPTITLMQGAELVLNNVAVIHSSKSVASNFAIFIGDRAMAEIEECTITSKTGSGVGVEGGALIVRNTEITNCKEHGVAVYDTPNNDPARCFIQETTISGCEGNGVQSRGPEAETAMDKTIIRNNRGFGVYATNEAVVQYINTKFENNKKGTTKAQNGAEVAEVTEEEMLVSDDEDGDILGENPIFSSDWEGYTEEDLDDLELDDEEEIVAAEKEKGAKK